MASISKQKGSDKLRIRFYDGDVRKEVSLVTGDRKKAEVIANMVDRIIEQRKTGGVDRLLTNWLKDIPDDLRERLARAGLIEEQEVVTIENLFERYREFKGGVTDSTLIVWGHAERNLITYFGQGRRIADITESDALRFKDWLPKQPPEERPAGKTHKKKSTVEKAKEAGRVTFGRCGVKGTLSPVTVAKRVSICKQVFTYGKRRGWIEGNPFEYLETEKPVNPERQYFVTPEMARKILEACPNSRWRSIFVLARFIGIRIPSELVGLKWSDIVWSDSENQIGRICITDQKRKRHEGKGTRFSPLWREAEKELRALFDEAKEGEEYIFPGMKATDNLRQTMEKIVFRAGVELYPKLFHNLRASRETEYHRAGINPTTYSRWIGNSPVIAVKHYVQYRDEDFQAGVNAFLAGSGNTEAGGQNSPPFSSIPKNQKTQNSLENTVRDGVENSPLFSPPFSPPQAVETACKNEQNLTQVLIKRENTQEIKNPCKSLQGRQMETGGIEPPSRDESTDASTCVFDDLSLVPQVNHRQLTIRTRPEQNLVPRVPVSDVKRSEIAADFWTPSASFRSRDCLY